MRGEEREERERGERREREREGGGGKEAIASYTLPYQLYSYPPAMVVQK